MNPSYIKTLLSRAAFILCALHIALLTGTLKPALAISLEEYRTRVQETSALLKTLLALQKAGNEFLSESEQKARQNMTLRAVRATLPASETIEWNGTKVLVDNAWLDEELKKCERLSLSDPARAALLAHSIGRLSALGERLAETQLTKTSNATSHKEENKARLAAILRRDEYSKRAAESSALARLWANLLKWLRNLFPQPKPLWPGKTQTASVVAQVFVIGLALSVIIFVFWKLAPRFRPHRLNLKGERGKARVVLGERIRPDETAADLLREAEDLARAGNLRAAIRKAYIALLCELSDRKLVRLAQHKTNSDYLKDVRALTSLHEEMRQLTHSFENHWYGYVPASESDWQNFRAHYQQALRQ